MSRQLCLRCMTSSQTCYCTDVQVVRTSIRFVILQHPLERRRTVGSARMAHLCLENSHICVGAGEEFDNHPKIQALLNDPENQCVVLYPGSRATNISVTPPKEWRSEKKNCVVFVIDGTWPCAKTMLKRSKSVRDLPQISFNAHRRSEYQFRRQPDNRCLSTLEAIHEVLTILEPEVESSVLMKLFRGMVKRQISFQAPGVSRELSRSTRPAPEELSLSPRQPQAT